MTNGYSDTGSLVFDDDVAADPPRTRQRTLPAPAPELLTKPPRVGLAALQVRSDLSSNVRGMYSTEAGIVVRDQLRAGGQAVAPLYARTMSTVRDQLSKDAARAGLAELYRRAWGTAP